MPAFSFLHRGSVVRARLSEDTITLGALVAAVLEAKGTEGFPIW